MPESGAMFQFRHEVGRPLDRIFEIFTRHIDTGTNEEQCKKQRCITKMHLMIKTGSHPPISQE